MLRAARSLILIPMQSMLNTSGAGLCPRLVMECTETTRFPTNGTNAKPPGKPGKGGNGGKLTTNLEAVKQIFWFFAVSRG